MQLCKKLGPIMACLDFEDKTYQPDIEGQQLTHKTFRNHAFLG